VKSKPRRGSRSASPSARRAAARAGKSTKAPRAKAARPADKKAKAATAKKERERAQKERERARVGKERLQAQKERERLQKEKQREAEKLKAQKQAEKLKADKERERLQKEKQREAEKLKADKERERLQKEKQRQAEKLKADKERDRALKEKEKQREAEKKAREKEKARLEKEAAERKEAEKKAKEAERARAKAEKEAERIRLKQERDAERDRLREEARQKKEEERARREAEREAYRKAKETEQSRLRAEREAARRALEGRVVKATRASRAAASGRAVGTTRVYTPSSIPDQSRTRRIGEAEGEPNLFANLRIPRVAPKPEGEPPRIIPRTIPPAPPPPPAASIEERYARINERLLKTDDAFRHEYEESLLMSWIYHDSALEGVVYTYEELRMAINPNITVVPDSSMQTVCDEIRRHKAAIEYVKDQADKKRLPITIDTVKKIYLILHPEEGDLKTVKYRKDIPQHRLYFHEYAAPDKIAYKVRQVFDWLNGPEPKKIRNTVRISARAHYDLLRVFPFALDSGKVSRLFMNLLLMRSDCPPALIHSTERQRYYEALRGQLPIINTMATEAITNALSSIEKKLDERDSKLHAFG
jgi:hypothetical protein